MSDLAPRHCTDPAIHGPHRYADDTDMRGCPGSSLSERVADALYTAPAIPTDAGERVARRTAEHDAQAVMGVVGPEIAKRDARINEESFKFLECIDDAANLSSARAALARVRELHTRETDECWDRCDYCDTDWPCPTITAIDRSTHE